jgi:hypothetical protein
MLRVFYHMSDVCSLVPSSMSNSFDIGPFYQPATRSQILMGSPGVPCAFFKVHAHVRLGRHGSMTSMCWAAAVLHTSSPFGPRGSRG